MKWQSFENKVNKELSGHRSEVDVDALWKAIEPEVDAINREKRRKRRGMFWLLFAGLLLLGSGAGFYFFNNIGKQNTAATNAVENNISDIKTDLNKNKKTDAETAGTAILNKKENDKPSTEIDISKKEKNIKETKNNTALNKNKNNFASAKTNISGKNKKGIKAENIAGLNKTGRSGVFNKKPIYIVENKSGKNTAAKNIAEIKTNLNKNADPEISQSAILNKKTNNAASANTGIFQKNKTGTIANNVSISKLPMLPIPVFPFFNKIKYAPGIILLNTNTLAEATNKDGAPPPAPGHPSSKKDYFISAEIIGGIAFAKRQLGIAAPLSGTLKTLREKSESPLETVQLGLRLNLRHKSGLGFSSGLNYTRINELFEYNKTVVQEDSIWGIAKRVINLNGDTLDIYGDVPLLTSTSILKKHYNSYTMLDIPVLVGYHFESGDWLLGAQAGVFANISMKANGQFLSDETTAVPIDDLFRNKVGLSYYLGLSASYQLNDRMALSLSPHFRYFPGNFATAGYALSQKYVLFGLNAGVRYQF
ncbi:MAG TPA: hypothetical protein ENJ95_09890 [Bacteroidetes bacterium]|nr:hypothetical protein [Bacteroidota bacterium]